MNNEQQDEAVRVRAMITGAVQGVNFRAECREQAVQNGLTGWVRNSTDGSVEAVFEGPRDSVQRMLAWCERGPSAARVSKVATRWEEPAGEDTRFDVRR